MADTTNSRHILADAIAQAGGSAWLFEQVATGRTIGELAKKLGFSRPLLSRWLNKADNKKRLIAAQEEAAYAITDEAQAIADNVQPEPDVPMVAAVAKAKLQIEVRRDRAAILNPTAFGQASGMKPSDLGELFVAALQSVATRKQIPATTTPIEPMAVEIVSEEKPA